MDEEITVRYDGSFPNLCSGTLTVTIGKTTWKFDDYCMVSGGRVWFDDEWDEHVESGPWDISTWPEGFPEELKETTLDAVNANVPHGCCGGCV